MSRICSRRRETSEERVRPEAYSGFGVNDHSKMWSERKGSSVVTRESVFSHFNGHVEWNRCAFSPHYISYV